MAENNTPPNDPGEIRGRRINIGENRVGATRIDPSTGDTKSLQTELLKGICDCINEQTEALKDVIEKSLGGTSTQTTPDIKNTRAQKEANKAVIQHSQTVEDATTKAALFTNALAVSYTHLTLPTIPYV